MQLTLFWLETTLCFVFCLYFIHNEVSCKVGIAFFFLIYWDIPNNSIWLWAEITSFVKKNWFSLGEIYSVLADSGTNTTWPLGRELCHGSTDLRVGCWNSTVHSTLAADDPCCPWPAQGYPESRVSWFRQLFWTDSPGVLFQCHRSASTSTSRFYERHALRKCGNWSYLYSRESPLAISLTSLISWWDFASCITMELS